MVGERADAISPPPPYLPGVHRPTRLLLYHSPPVHRHVLLPLASEPCSAPRLPLASPVPLVSCPCALIPRPIRVPHRALPAEETFPKLTHVGRPRREDPPASSVRLVLLKLPRVVVLPHRSLLRPPVCPFSLLLPVHPRAHVPASLPALPPSLPMEASLPEETLVFAPVRVLHQPSPALLPSQPCPDVHISVAVAPQPMAMALTVDKLALVRSVVNVLQQE
eukprot:768453-Hanusia_phi.AAC.5